jgi:prepilin-type N-terminal cleavage/methylation domain-containing protein
MIKNKTSLRGFTLLELIVVIAIIGVLSVIILPSFTTALARSRDGRKISELRGIQAGLVQFAQNNNGFYPAATAMPTQTAGCSSITVATTSLCAIINSGIDNRLPSGVYSNNAVYNYVGVACTTGTGGMCLSYQLWTNLEQSNAGLTSDADVTTSNATSTYSTTTLTTSGVIASTTANTFGGIQNGSTETCNGGTNTCVFDLVP